MAFDHVYPGFMRGLQRVLGSRAWRLFVPDDRTMISFRDVGRP